MADTPARRTPPSADEFEALARTALDTIPARLRRHIADVVLRIEDFPDEETCEEMGLASEFDLLGLYRGVDLARRSVLDTPQELDMIFSTGGRSSTIGARPARTWPMWCATC